MEKSTLYSIGHGNKSIEVLIEELKHFGIDYLIDIRSKPYSKYNPQYNQSSNQVIHKNKMLPFLHDLENLLLHRRSYLEGTVYNHCTPHNLYLLDLPFVYFLLSVRKSLYQKHKTFYYKHKEFYHDSPATSQTYPQNMDPNTSAHTLDGMPPPAL